MIEKKSGPSHHGRKEWTNYTECHMLHKIQLFNPIMLYTCIAQDVAYSGLHLKQPSDP